MLFGQFFSVTTQRKQAKLKVLKNMDLKCSHVIASSDGVIETTKLKVDLNLKLKKNSNTIVLIF